MPRKAISRWYSSACLFLRKCLILFQSDCAILHSHQQCIWESISLHPCQHLVLSLLFYCSHSAKCVVISHCFSFNFKMSLSFGVDFLLSLMILAFLNITGLLFPKMSLNLGLLAFSSWFPSGYTCLTIVLYMTLCPLSIILGATWHQFVLLLMMITFITWLGGAYQISPLYRYFPLPPSHLISNLRGDTLRMLNILLIHENCRSFSHEHSIQTPALDLNMASSCLKLHARTTQLHFQLLFRKA